MASGEALWWKFPVQGLGVHLLRAKGLGTPVQEVLLDGSLLEAPEGTTTFTGPGASLLELRPTEGGWTLTVDGAAIESYSPEEAPAEAPPVAWWKFALPGLGMHHLRVKGIDLPGQEILLDGAPLDAPEGTMAFTGPGGVLLELQRREGVWVLLVDGTVVHQCGAPGTGSSSALLWSFALPGTGAHLVRLTGAGTTGQELLVDGVAVPAPPGQLTFTGPGGALLELKQSGDSWTLFVDGTAMEADAEAAAEANWSFLAPGTGAVHEMRVVHLGGKGQQAFLDGALVPGPEGQQAFTGPGGALLELRRGADGWALLVDGRSLQEHNALVRASGVAAPATAAAPVAAAQASEAAVRAPIASAGTLPQGVSHDAASGRYTASMRVGGRFRCLGNFSTPEEAHARYLQAKKETGEA